MSEEKKESKAFLSVLGRAKAEVEMSGPVTASQLLREAGVERVKGETIMLDSEEVTEDTLVKEGQTLYYVPPVQLGPPLSIYYVFCT
jgi:hypothetical protein